MRCPPIYLATSKACIHSLGTPLQNIGWRKFQIKFFIFSFLSIYLSFFLSILFVFYSSLSLSLSSLSSFFISLTNSFFFLLFVYFSHISSTFFPSFSYSLSSSLSVLLPAVAERITYDPQRSQRLGASPGRWRGLQHPEKRKTRWRGWWWSGGKELMYPWLSGSHFLCSEAHAICSFLTNLISWREYSLFMPPYLSSCTPDVLFMHYTWLGCWVNMH